MNKVNLNWKNLGYDYHETDYSYQADWKDGKWSEGSLVTDHQITIYETSAGIHYAQACFEGLKAVTAKDGSINVFRMDLNAERFQDSCERVRIPEISKEQFMDSIYKVVSANKRWVPPYDEDYNTALYIRPFAFGHGPKHGASAAPYYMYRVYVLPVGAHYGELKPITMVISDYDRAAPNGSGNCKVAANYAEGLLPSYLAKQQGYTECLYLDSKTHTLIEESGGANFVAVTKDNKVISPKSNTILNSVTRRSLLQIAREYLDLEAYETEISVDDLSNMKEAFLCGTGAAITPIGGIMAKKGYIEFGDGKTAGMVTKKLFEIYKGIQRGTIEAPNGWIYKID